jgi:glucokinase
MLHIGYDIGGTKCAVSLGRIDNDTIEVLDKRKFPTVGTPQEIMEKLLDAVEELLAERGLVYRDIAAAGISCGGPLDSRRGVILSPPNLPDWDEIPIVATLEARTNIPTRLQNDANACAVAEWKFGAGKGARDMAFLTFGTGLGAGLILGGRLHSGASDMAGEVGHIRLAEDGPPGYGKFGSAEGFCSGSGIARTAVIAVENALARGERPDLLDAAGGDTANITAKLIAERAYAGDAFCRAIYENCGRKLGLLLSMMMDMINPELIVIGSVFVRSESLLRPAMEEVIALEALPHAARACRVVPAALGESIGDYAALSVAYMGEG